MVIRKVSIGTDYKSGAMHYIVGNFVLNNSHRICRIKQNDNGSIDIYIINDKQEIVTWKKIGSQVPVVIEYDIDFTPFEGSD
jgi:hypothetical protein